MSGSERLDTDERDGTNRKQARAEFESLEYEVFQTRVFRGDSYLFTCKNTRKTTKC